MIGHQDSFALMETKEFRRIQLSEPKAQGQALEGNVPDNMVIIGRYSWSRMLEGAEIPLEGLVRKVQLVQLYLKVRQEPRESKDFEVFK